MSADEVKRLTNPFIGIRSFEPGEDYLFFGRELRIGDLIAKLSINKFVAVIGSSGSGKSSLIRAGLIPSLQRGKKDIIEGDWRVTITNPGDTPLKNLSDNLFKTLAEEAHNPFASADDVRKQLLSGPGGLQETLHQIQQQDTKNTLLIIDQFEELFRRVESGRAETRQLETELFISELLTAVRNADTSLYIVVAMRSDFLDDCTDYEGLIETINDGFYMVPRMSRGEISEAITGPVKVAGGAIDEGLVERLIDDVVDDQDQLPLLQHALMRTWDYWTEEGDAGEPINITHYEAIGTILKALSYHAEEVYRDLPGEKERQITEKLFKALTDLGAEGRGIRRPCTLKDICEIGEFKEDDVVDVIERFRERKRAFLLPSPRVRLSSATVIDIAHESLMRIWERLSEWVEEETKSAQTYLRLARSAELYQEGKTGLWKNPQLQLALDWRKQYNPTLAWARRYNPHYERTLTFLDYSAREHEKEIERKEKSQKAELKRARIFAGVLGGASILSIMFLIVSLNLTFKAESSEKIAREQEKFAVSQSKRAENKRREAITQKIIAEQQQDLAEQQKVITEEQRQYALEQQRIAMEERQQALMQKQAAESASRVARAAKDTAETQRQLALESKRAAEISEAEAQRLRLLAVAKAIAIQAVKLNNSGEPTAAKLLAMQAYRFQTGNGGAKYEPDVFNALTQTAGDPAVLRGHRDGVRAVDVSSSGRKLVSCSNDGTVKMWELNSPDSRPAELETGPYGSFGFRSVAVSPDGGIAAAGGFDGSLLYWNLDAAGQYTALRESGETVDAVLFSPDGATLCAVSHSGEILLYDFGTTPVQSKVLREAGSKLNAIAYSADGAHLAAGGADGITLYAAKGKSEARSMQPGSGEVMSLAFNPAGTEMIAGYEDGKVYYWKLDQPETVVELIGHLSRVSAVAWNPLGGSFASASYDGTIRIYNSGAIEEPPVIIGNGSSWVYDISYLPDGSSLAAANADRSIVVWSVDPEEIAGRICSRVDRNLTRDEWDDYIGNSIEYQKTCPDLETASR